MKKIAILTDLHFGITSNDSIVEKKTCQWLQDFFYPYIKENDIKKIVFLGDLFHNRKAINTESGTNVLNYFISLLPDDVEMIVIPGNHDSFFNSDSSINSPTLLMHKHDNITVINEPVYIKELNADFFPWGRGPKDFQRGIYAFGHFDVIGARMNTGIICVKGHDVSAFEHYEKVFSGHYHMPSIMKNVEYVGNPIEQNWGEIDFDHRFIVFDGKKVESIKTPDEYKIFEKIIFEECPNTELENYKDKVVKVYTNERTNYSKLLKFRDSLSEQGVINVNIIETGTKDDIEDNDIDYEELNTVDMLCAYIDDNVSVDESDIELLKQLNEKFYTESVNDV